MIAKLFDRTEMVVTKAEADELAQAITDDTQVIYLKRLDMMISSPRRTIAYIMPGGDALPPRLDEAHRLPSRTDHRGEYSPALEKMRAHFAAKKVGNFTRDKNK